MSDSYTNLLYHIVFSTKERRPRITPEYEPRLYEYIGGTIRGLGGVSLELNGTEIMFTFWPSCAQTAHCLTCCAHSKPMQLDGCMMFFRQLKISHGNVGMAYLR